MGRFIYGKTTHCCKCYAIATNWNGWLIKSRDIKNGIKTPYDFMQEYKRRIVADDFEAAKAITEVLKPLNYDTADTHPHIKQLNELDTHKR